MISFNAILSDKAIPGIRPFYLYKLPPAESHLCPVRALANWINIGGFKSGYLFRSVWTRDRISNNDHPIASIFSSLLRS